MQMILQYTDDMQIPNGVATLTILCLENDIIGAINMKLLLYLYELMSGLKINFSKSEVVVLNGDDDIASQYADTFNCQVGPST
jgi:hypothetical protein